MRAGLHHALEAGRLLIEAKAGLPHGAWLPWLRDNCKVPERTAQLYMRLARELPAQIEARKSASLAHLTVSEAADLLARHREPEKTVLVRAAVTEPEPGEPLRVRLQSWPAGSERAEPLRATVTEVHQRPLRSGDIIPAQPVSAADVAAPTPASGEEPGDVSASMDAGERARLISCGATLEGARSLTEVSQRLQALAQRLAALERDGWHLHGPMTGEDVVTIVRTWARS